MKRYMLFMFDAAYPGGGALDFDNDFDSIDEVSMCLKEKDRKLEYRLPIWHVFDSELRFIVACSAWIDERNDPNKVIPEVSYGSTSNEIKNPVEPSENLELVVDVQSWR